MEIKEVLRRYQQMKTFSHFILIFRFIFVFIYILYVLFILVYNLLVFPFPIPFCYFTFSVPLLVLYLSTGRDASLALESFQNATQRSRDFILFREGKHCRRGSYGLVAAKSSCEASEQLSYGYPTGWLFSSAFEPQKSVRKSGKGQLKHLPHINYNSNLEMQYQGCPLAFHFSEQTMVF